MVDLQPLVVLYFVVLSETVSAFVRQSVPLFDSLSAPVLVVEPLPGCL